MDGSFATPETEAEIMRRFANMKSGISLISAERLRQIEQEGFTAEHDAKHKLDELALAACYYAMPERMLFLFPANWHQHWAKRDNKGRIRQLVTAGALVAAEIDRLNAEEKI
jgi:hypothetical protein